MESHSQNKENIDEFRKFISQQKPTNTKIKTQSENMEAFCLTENENREVSNLHPGARTEFAFVQIFKKCKET